ncbi:LPXTG cell wall anchor domain-containing protein [Enterococcus faecalis]
MCFFIVYPPYFFCPVQCNLPKTGEYISSRLLVIGMLLLVISLSIFFVKDSKKIS